MKKQLRKSIFLQNYSSVFRSIPQTTLVAENAVNRFHKIDQSNGRSTAIAHSKQVYDFMKFYFVKQEPEFNHKLMWLKLFKGVPKFLFQGFKEFPEELLQEPLFQQAVLTACRYYMIYNTEIDNDISTVTNPSSVDLDSPSVEELIEDIGTFSDKFFKQRNINPFTPSDDLPIYATTKAGAHGASAMSLNGLRDLMALRDQSILCKIKEFLPLVYIEESANKLISLIDESLAIDHTLEYNKNLTARIHQFPDGGGKTRTICIPDIWTQSWLKPIHLYLMNRVLPKLPCDGTFSHDLSARRVRRRTLHESLYCFDLTAVTDRLPIKLQERVLTSLLGTELAQAWKSIIVERDIYFNGRTIRYAVGQPMGMLSSWAAMAITHHMIINYCKKDKSFYQVIGDDMVMSSKVASEKYRDICEKLGIEINRSKSVIPKTASDKCGEIAKRVFSSGCEISPIPPKVLIQATEDLSGLLEFIRVLVSRTHSPLGSLHLDIGKIIELLVTTSKLYYNPSVHIILSCPVLWKKFTLLPPLPPISGLRVCWTEGVTDRMISNELDQYLTVEANNIINKYALDKGLLPGLPGKSLGGVDLQNGVTPLIKTYMAEMLIKVKALINVHGTSYEDEQDDSFAKTPNELILELHSIPDPFDTRDFRTKRVLRERRTLELIKKFWTNSRFKNREISFPVPE
jgi:hypothetical protein